MDKGSLHEQIEAFLTGTLTGKALSDFEELMAANPEVQLEVQIHKDLHTFLKEEQKVDNFETILKKEATAFIQQEEEQEEQINRFANRFGWMTVAALVLFGLLYVAYSNLQTGPDYDKLYAANFEPVPLTAIDRSQLPAIDSLERLAIQAYQQKDYSQAAVHFNNLLLTAEEDKIEWAFYEGVSWMSKTPANIIMAIETFESVRAAKDHPLQQSSFWYSALGELSIGNDLTAIEYLQSAKALPGKYRSRSEQLLNQLR